MSTAARLQQSILDEVARAFGARPRGLVRRICGGLFALPTGRFARQFASADREVGRGGLGSGCGYLLARMGVAVTARGTEQLPAGDPLLVVSNHPGAYDSVALASCIRRPDLKILLYEVPFYHGLANASGSFIYAGDDPVQRMTALRGAIRHLQEGGALVHFGTGIIEPDPALGPGAITALRRWSRSVEILLRQVPQTRLVLAAASGVMLPLFSRCPLRLLQADLVGRRRLAEYLQVMSALVFPRRFRVTVRLTLAPPVFAAQLSSESPGRGLMPAILARERRLLEEHRAAWHG